MCSSRSIGIIATIIVALGCGTHEDFRTIPGESEGESEGSDAGDGDGDPDCTAAELGVGGDFTCVLQADGDVVCWGDNRMGTLGHGHTEDLGDDELPNAAGPIELGGPALALAAGRAHACVIEDGQQVRCWGASSRGALGYGELDIIGNNELPSEAGPVEVGAKVRSIHAGPQTTCAITFEDDELICWGANANGQLGYGHEQAIGDDESPASAGIVELGGPVIDVALSVQNTCAVVEGGDVRCWGLRGAKLGAGVDVGQDVGDDELPTALPPIDLGGPAQAIAAGFYHFCALLESGALVCWGDNFEGQLGYGQFETLGDDEPPAAAGPVPIGEPVIAVALGLLHSCALAKSGAAYCWGADGSGRLGYPDVDGFIGGELTPAEVGPIALPGPVDELGAGDAHTCARLGAEVICWGSGTAGRLGYGDELTIGDDEPPASGGSIAYCGGQGNGGVAPIPNEFDGQTDAILRLTWHDPKPPAGLAVGQMVTAAGSYWPAFDCEGCGASEVIRAADDQTLLVARIQEDRQLHPELGIMNMIGLEPATWLAPLELETEDLGLCPILEGNEVGDDCFGVRLALDVEHPEAPTARLLDGRRGPVGGGYIVSVGALEDWTEACATVDEQSRRSVVILRRDCAPDCGPVEFIDDCAAPQNDLDFAYLSFVGERRPIDPGYDLTCEVLEHELEDGEIWAIALDCVGAGLP